MLTDKMFFMENLLWILSIVGASIVFFIFQFFFSYKLPQNIDPFTLQRISKKCDKLELLTIFLIFPLAISIGLGVYYLGLYITNNMPSERYIYIQQAPVAFWGILGVVLGIGLIRAPLTLIFRAILKDEYDLYIAYTNLKHGWDGLKVWRVIEYILCTAGIILFILGLNWYVRIDTSNREVEFNNIFSLETFSCALTDISEIKHSPKIVLSKDEIIKEVFTINVDTTYTWNSKYYGYFTDIEDDFTKLSEGVNKLSNYANLAIIE